MDLLKGTAPKDIKVPGNHIAEGEKFLQRTKSKIKLLKQQLVFYILKEE